MKALVVHTLSDDLSGCALTDVPEPQGGPGKLIVRMRAASLNYPDLLMTRGLYQLKPPLPFTPGMEMAGEVVEADVQTGFVPGERVACATRTGAFAERVVCDASAARRIPAGIDHATAAALGAVYLTAWVALVRLARVQPGEWVLVHGATGGVGLAAVDLARALGARVIATSRSPDKLAVVAAGYHPDAILPASGFREVVKALTGSRGADVVLDPVGGDTFDESARCTAFGGRLLVTGFTSGRIASVATNIPLMKGFAVIGVRAGEYGRRRPEHHAQDRETIWRMAQEGRITPRVHASWPLADWKRAFDALRHSEHVGKLVLTA